MPGEALSQSSVGSRPPGTRQADRSQSATAAAARLINQRTGNCGRATPRWPYDISAEIEDAGREIPVRSVAHARMDALFDAVIDATEEAILNAMLQSPTMCGHRCNFLPYTSRTKPIPLGMSERNSQSGSRDMSTSLWW